MLDQVSAQGVRVADEISESACSIRAGLFFLISQQLHEEWHTGLQMLVKDVVVEACISDGKARELPGVSIGVSATLNGRGNESEIEELLVEVPRVSAQVSDKVAHLGSDGGVRMHNQILEVVIDVGVVDVLVEVFRYTRQLRNQTQRVYDDQGVVVGAQESILVDDSEPVRLDKLLGELFGTLSAKHQS